jgi:hypothetical protein
LPSSPRLAVGGRSSLADDGSTSGVTFFGMVTAAADNLGMIGALAYTGFAWASATDSDCIMLAHLYCFEN